MIGSGGREVVFAIDCETTGITRHSARVLSPALLLSKVSRRRAEADRRHGGWHGHAHFAVFVRGGVSSLLLSLRPIPGLIHRPEFRSALGGPPTLSRSLNGWKNCEAFLEPVCTATKSSGVTLLRGSDAYRGIGHGRGRNFRRSQGTHRSSRPARGSRPLAGRI